jgi:uncharacterized membrane protein YeaQ/YmgE (transglycosylase-associated protein family)
VANFIAFVLVGLIVGVVARMLMPGRDPIGVLGTIIVGIIGAVIGGYLWREAFGNTHGPEWIGSILAAMALLWIYRRMFIGRRTLV